MFYVIILTEALLTTKGALIDLVSVSPLFTPIVLKKSYNSNAVQFKPECSMSAMQSINPQCLCILSQSQFRIVHSKLTNSQAHAMCGKGNPFITVYFFVQRHTAAPVYRANRHMCVWLRRY